jgi:hypothetical protein
MTHNYSLLPDEFNLVSIIVFVFYIFYDYLVGKSLQSIINNRWQRIDYSNRWNKTIGFTSNDDLYSYINNASKIKISSKFLFQSNCYWWFVEIFSSLFPLFLFIQTLQSVAFEH